ncbi:MAG: hypothetical protein ACYC6L_07395 [Anaerolineae bacterium]
MLDLSVESRQLTQGREPSAMVLALLRSIAQLPANQDIEAAVQASPPSKAQIDVPALARRVYELMRQDLATRARRLGGGVR